MHSLSNTPRPQKPIWWLNLESDRQIANKTDLDARYILGPLENTLPALAQLLGVASTGRYTPGV